MSKRHLLFICTANVCRSPLAASLFDSSDIFVAKSAGIHIQKEYPHSIPVTQDLVDWADEILVMSEIEDHHLTYLKQNFCFDNKKISVLGIPNIYDTSVPEIRDELTKILKEKLKAYLSN